MAKFVSAFIIGLLFVSQSALAQNTTSLTSAELASRTVYRRAVDAAIWGMPIVSLDAMRQAYFRDAKAKYNDIIWWPEGSGWKNQSLTVNTTVRYMYFFCNTRDDGPVVFELPSAIAGASFYGTIVDAWQVPLVDVGDGGKSGKYLVLPPDYTSEVPAGYIAVRPKTYNTYTLLRSILASTSEEDVRKGDALVNQIKIYPLTKANNPPTQRTVDMTDIMYDGLVHYDESLYASLARTLNEETVQPRDLEMMGMLLPLGIEKGKEFKPDAATVAQLRSAAAEAHAWLFGKQITFITPWWPDSKWTVPSLPIGPQTDFNGRSPTTLMWFFGPPAKLGTGSFYLGAYFDSRGQPLRGENTYRLRVPANVPVSEFWAVTVYSQETAALFRDSTRLTLGSLDQGVRKNADGSVDLYIGPKPPAGQESNWLYTPAGKGWFPWSRAYGPEKPFLDKSWKMPDIEKIN